MSGESPGRAVQGRIYRAGALGRRPRVPVLPRRLERAAQRSMSREAWAYVAGSAGQQRTARANLEAFTRYRLVPRMLRGVAARDTSVDLLGTRLPAPVLLAPVGVLELAHRGADVAVARAAARLGVPMVVSTQASRSMEEIASANGASSRWFQLYWSRDRELVASFVRRAEAAGYGAIVVTLDTHLLGWRPFDLDLGHLPFARGLGIAQYTSDPVFTRLVRERAGRARGAAPGKTPSETVRPRAGAVRTLLSQARAYPGRTAANLRSPLPRAAVETFLDVFADPSLTWDDLAFLRELTDLPIVVKGIQHPADADLAVAHGAAAVVVSNHGGRQVDGAVASLDALGPVVAAVQGRVPVLFDSGIRGGADVAVALALGATAVLVGRPYVYGLALGGTDGVVAVLENLVAEFDLTLGLVGCRTPAELGPDALVRPGDAAGWASR